MLHTNVHTHSHHLFIIYDSGHFVSSFLPYTISISVWNISERIFFVAVFGGVFDIDAESKQAIFNKNPSKYSIQVKQQQQQQNNSWIVVEYYNIYIYIIVSGHL